MRYIIFFFLVFSLFGCSPKSLENFVEKSLIATSGNKPPNNFKIANIETMRDYVFDMPDYSISLPSAKEEDFRLMNGWEGATINNKDLVLYPGMYGIYHIYVTSSVYKYEDSERAAEYKNNEYLKTDQTAQYRKHKNGEETNINVHYETHGKENYACIVTSSKHDEYGKKGTGYSCFKANKKRTLVKDISIRLTYQKSPNFPKEYSDLTKDYTYEDLQQRAERMLDSLYIKDGWDK
jgi:hypothetical protein